MFLLKGSYQLQRDGKHFSIPTITTPRMTSWHFATLHSNQDCPCFEFNPCKVRFFQKKMCSACNGQTEANWVWKIVTGLLTIFFLIHPFNVPNIFYVDKRERIAVSADKPIKRHDATKTLYLSFICLSGCEWFLPCRQACKFKALSKKIL